MPCGRRGGEEAGGEWGMDDDTTLFHSPIPGSSQLLFTPAAAKPREGEVPARGHTGLLTPCPVLFLAHPQQWLHTGTLRSAGAQVGQERRPQQPDPTYLVAGCNFLLGCVSFRTGYLSWSLSCPDSKQGAGCRLLCKWHGGKPCVTQCQGEENFFKPQLLYLQIK